MSDESTYFDVIYDIDSNICSPRNVTTGVLAIQLGSVPFPHPQWDDFIVRTLAEWVNLTRIIVDTNDAAVFRFMDGDPEFRVSPLSSGQFSVMCYVARGTRGNAPMGIVDPLDFANAMRRAAKVTENWVRRNSCKDPEIQYLTDGLAALQDEISRRERRR